MKNPLENINAPTPIDINQATPNSYVDDQYHEPSIIKDTRHADFSNHNLVKIRFVSLTSYPAVGEHLTAKHYVDEAISNSVDESSLLRLNSNEELKLDEQDSTFLQSFLTSPKTIIELTTKAYVDSIHENSRNRRDLSTVFKDQDNVFNKKKLKKLDSIAVNRNKTTNNELSAKKRINDSIGGSTIVIFNQTQENCHKVSVGNDV